MSSETKLVTIREFKEATKKVFLTCVQGEESKKGMGWTGGWMVRVDIGGHLSIPLGAPPLFLSVFKFP